MLLLLGCALIERLRAPSPFVGELDLDAAVVASAPVADQDLPVLRRRLDVLGVDGSVEVIDPQRLRVRLENVRDADVLGLLLERGDLGFFEVLDWPEGTAPPGGSFDGGTLRGPDAGFFAAIQPGPGTRVLPDCEPESGCEGLLLRNPPSLTGRDLADARYQRTDWGPAVAITFTAQGAERFAALSGALVGRRLAIVIDDEVLSAPIVREAISGGTAIINLATTDTEVEAHALAAALQSGALAGDWVIERL